MSDGTASTQGMLNIVKQYGFEYFGIFYGHYRGFITNNRDPKNLGRVQVKIPQLAGGEKIEAWAWPAGNPAGDDYGDFMIPPRGSLVWVFFENGSLENPVYMGGHWGKSDSGGAVPEEARNNVRNCIRKTENWIFELDDENDVARLRRRDTDFRLELTGDGVITINGETINITGTQVNIEGDSVNINGDTVGVSGSAIDLNGGVVGIDGSSASIMGRDFIGHTHSGVDAGGGTSGGVV